MNELNYHTDFIAEHDIVQAMPSQAVDIMRAAWGAHHDDYAPPEKKFLTPEFEGGNKAAVQKIRKLKAICLKHAQTDMDKLALG